MTKLSNEEKDRIIKRDLPGFKLVEEEPRDSAEGSGQDDIKAQPDAGTPDFRELRRKYFGESANESDAADAYKGTGNPGDESNDDEIVQVAPENTSDVLDRGSRAKSVVISRGEIKGSQG